jgi:hypothetical protein
VSGTRNTLAVVLVLATQLGAAFADVSTRRSVPGLQSSLSSRKTANQWSLPQEHRMELMFAAEYADGYILPTALSPKKSGIMQSAMQNAAKLFSVRWLRWR